MTPSGARARHLRFLPAGAALLCLLAAARVSHARELRIGIAVDRDRVVVGVERGTLEADGLAAPLPLERELVLTWPRNGSRPDAQSVYRIQVGALASEDDARRSAEELGRLVTPAAATLDPESRTHRVRGGAFATREEALEALKSRVARTYPDAFVVEEAKEGARSGLVAALAALDRRIDVAGTLTLRPAAGTLLVVDGARYRGTLEIRLGTKGTLNAIDVVELEDYLRGVVPKEMGPGQYPEVEALKAQAVAARTYALASLNGFPEEGYDLCATPRCQVYGGADAEQPLTDRAVAETRDLVLTSGDALAKAYFSATCGGHTEDVENVFVGDAKASYLRGVPCAPEEDLAFRLPKGGRVTTLRAEDGTPLAGPIALLRGAGVLASIPTDEALKAPLPEAEALTLVRAAARAAGRAPGDDAVHLGSPVTLGAFLDHVAHAFALDERAEVLLTDADVAALVRAPDAEALPVPARRTLAALALAKALPAFPDGKLNRSRTVSRGLAIAIVGRLLEGLAPALVREGPLVRAEPGSVVLRRGGVDEAVALAADALLLRGTGTSLVAFGGGVLRPGDTVRVLGPEGSAARALILVESESGADDRRARDSRWTVSLTAEEVDQKVGESYAIGRLRDLRVAARGSSGRPTELVLVGTEGEARVKGFAIKRLLGLKDDLFVVERVLDARGQPSAFRFVGRGWGHGVGLCQEGSFGMALRGQDFRAILKHYYPGATIVPYATRAAASDIDRAP